MHSPLSVDADREQLERDKARDRLGPAGPLLPAGIVATQVTQYSVGPYRYTKLSDALEENRRRLARIGH